MAEDTNQEKTEPATQRRMEQAREKGQVAKSTEVNTLFILGFSMLFFIFYGASFVSNLKELFTHYFGLIPEMTLTLDEAQQLIVFSIKKLLWVLAPFIILLFVVSVFANIAQIGFLFTTEPLVPKLSKITPLSGFKKIFSRRSLIELLKSIFKVLLVGLVAFLTIKGKYTEIMLSADRGLKLNILFANHLILLVIFRILLVIIAIALIDFLFQKWDHSEQLKMTKQEVKEEMKQFEGDPLIKSRIRTIQREMSRKRMLQKIPEAEVVITNPTHYAIAIQYDSIENPAPIVLAKGIDFLAQKIKELAQENDIPMVENRPLAQALYKACEPGDFIPEDLYGAVAEVLSYVYRIKGKNVA